MTYVVTEKCIGCRHGSCVDVCPTDAFHLGPNMLVINPVACIDCAACVSACPERAIFASSKIQDPRLIDLNKKLSGMWPQITQAPEGPLPTADEYRLITATVDRLKKLVLK